MQQIVDLHSDPAFQQLDVALVSIAFDSPAELGTGIQQYGIQDVPMLSDTTHEVSEEYGVLEWTVTTGEPGHTFVLVNTDGTVAWIRDYGAPQNGGVMYVQPSDLVEQIGANLDN
jgi:peroxiredoxin